MTSTTETATVLARPYHHGDLSRALVQAGRRILEREGLAALSLRAVAREAGVSPAAPYHHFRHRCDLLDAVAGEGWMELGAAIAKARTQAPEAALALTAIGVACVRFARENPALYRVMYDGACDRETMGDCSTNANQHVKEAIIGAGADPDNAFELELASIATWCAAHGVAEMAGFKEFEPLKAALGGEEAFVRAVLDHVGIFSHRARTPLDSLNAPRCATFIESLPRRP
jgi:AcrR family transcriptional regulator